ncbi:acyl-CoA thioester hydrolase [Draconibacterium orientale]|jgi:acyl-CoA thioester hydrolase|uniref:Acyl-CoA thioester hydrolase n=1 Tax=Draconibacterium orientale TaxID=1168034 RepID=X5DAT7_9BACT|nr:acyl-CoA thioesterase [Draconibacterium orientale]AHW59908.1 acyl-CoA thioester hydrolase [Draconibacterium orientale]SEU10376.1 acyl-CoA thioester hydrolase [Draconibacterium orientale]
MKQKHSVPVQIRFNDIDLMGHVYNAKYQEFFDLARLNYFKTVLGELISWTHKGLIIASVKVDYLQPTFLEDEIHVETSVSSLGEKSLEMTQAVYKNHNPEPVAICKSVMVCFDMKARVSEPIPEVWRKKFTDFEPGLGVNQSVG